MNRVSRRVFLGGMAATTLVGQGFHVFAASGITGLKFMTEEYPPFNYRENGELQGISVEIMIEIFGRTNSGLTARNIELLPWARGYNLTLTKENHALFSTTRTAERETLFKWVGPFAANTIGLIARKDRNITVNTIDDIRGLKIGVVKDDVGHLLLRAAGMADSELDIVLTNDSNYKKLIAGRLDVISYATEVARWGLMNLGENPLDYDAVYELKRGDLYLALNPQTDDRVVAELQDAFDSMVTDGTHGEILSAHLGEA
ncbi:MAG: transporter substrate-binding domain-containing protein [Fimbriimonadaceae bacterium]|nr:transporter substrate-binding domain-containing protein [Alphaproteobacteria bacterium]